MNTVSAASELLVQTALSVLYQNFFSRSLGLDVVTPTQKRSLSPLVSPTLKKRAVLNEVTGKASIKTYLTEGGKASWVSSKPHLKQRKPIDPALEELVINSDDSEPPKNPGKKRGGSKPDFLRYSDLILQEELRVADDVSEFAQSMEDQLSGELTRKKTGVKKVRQTLVLTTGEPIKPGKQRKYTKILGVEQPEYSTMSTFYIETVEIPSAVEMLVPELDKVVSQTSAMDVDRPIEASVPYHLIKCRYASSIRNPMTPTFESLRLEFEGMREFPQ